MTQNTNDRRLSEAISSWTLDFINPQYEKLYRYSHVRQSPELGSMMRAAAVLAVLQIFRHSIHEYFQIISYICLLLLFIRLGLVVTRSGLVIKDYHHTAALYYVLAVGPIYLALLYRIFGPGIMGRIDLLVASLHIAALGLSLRFMYVVGLISLASFFEIFTQLYSPHYSLDESVLFTSNIIVLSFGVAVSSYIKEFLNRGIFLHSQNLMVSKRLDKEFESLQSSVALQIADLESPLEKAILYASCLLSDPESTDRQTHLVNMILACLNESNLMAPDLYQQLLNGNVTVDNEQEVSRANLEMAIQ